VAEPFRRVVAGEFPMPFWSETVRLVVVE